MERTKYECLECNAVHLIEPHPDATPVCPWCGGAVFRVVVEGDYSNLRKITHLWSLEEALRLAEEQGVTFPPARICENCGKILEEKEYHVANPGYFPHRDIKCFVLLDLGTMTNEPIVFIKET